MSVNLTTPEPEHVGWILLENVTEAFGKYVTIIASIIGFIGNCFSIKIFFNRMKKDNASASYLGPLAISDNFNILLALYNWLTRSGLNLLDFAGTDFLCRRFTFCHYVGMHCIRLDYCKHGGR